MDATILVVQGAGDLHDPEGTIVLIRYLERELAGAARVVVPEMPDAEADPRYAPWREAIREHIDVIEGGVHVVGHSFGGSVVLKMLAEGSPAATIKSLHLVAMPWWGDEGWSWDELALPKDAAAHLADVPIFLYHSLDDPHVPVAHLALYEAALPAATVRRIPGAEHSFREGLPELIDDLRSVADQDPRPTAAR